MNESFKTLGNLGASFLLLVFSTWLAYDDITYTGDIFFQKSGGIAWLLLFIPLWFLVSLFTAVFPKRFLIPAILFFVCRYTLGYPLSLWVTTNQACIGFSVALAILAVVYFLGCVFQFAGVEKRKWLGLKHSFVMLVSGIFVAILTLSLTLRTTRQVVGDYLQFSLRSISMLERVFQRGGKTVHLVGMMHLGDEEFYEGFEERLRQEVKGKRVVLSEGVSDENGILPESFASGETHQKMASQLGLQAQGANSRELTPEEKKNRARRWAEKGVYFINADIDVSELSPEHQETLVELLKPQTSGNFFDMLKSSPNVPDEDLEDLTRDGLLKFRNDRLMEKFNEVLRDDVDEIYIPWGAAHLPDIEDRLLKLGFEKIHEEKRPAIRFWK